jgi:predicted PurR-regulated permease PerM
MEKEMKISGYFLIIMIILSLVIGFLMIKSFIAPILTGLLIAYIFYPVYRKVNRYIKNETISASLLIVFIFVIILLPLLLIIKSIFDQSLDFYHNFDYDYFINVFSSYLSPEIGLYMKSLFDEALLFIAKSTSVVILSLPHKIISVFVMFFVLFYSFKESKKIQIAIKKYLPLKEKYKEELINKFKDVVNAITYGLIITSIIQGFVGTIGLMIFGVNNPLLWGLVMAFLAMVPLLGTGLVWVPASLYKIYNGDMFNGIGLLLYGALIISTIDNFIRPKLISKKSNIHPVVVLLGLLGGLTLFGVVGIILGPFILSIILLFFNFYRK